MQSSHEPILTASRSWAWWVQRALGIIATAVIVAAAVYVISDRVAASYESSAIVRISVPATGGISDPSVTAANDLASQFAQLASAEPVVTAASARLGSQGANLKGDVTSGTIAAQNLIRISVKGASAPSAQARTTAVAEAFVAYLNNLGAKQAAAYSKAVLSRLSPLKREIAAARRRLSSKNAEVQRNATILLSSLIAQQQAVLSNVAQSSVAAQPSLELVAPGGSGTKVSPKPSLYAAIGFVVTLLLLSRLVFVLGVRQPRLGEASP